jgi:hypothetical protein
MAPDQGWHFRHRAGCSVPLRQANPAPEVVETRGGFEACQSLVGIQVNGKQIRALAQGLLERSAAVTAAIQELSLTSFWHRNGIGTASRTCLRNSS